MVVGEAFLLFGDTVHVAGDRFDVAGGVVAVGVVVGDEEVAWVGRVLGGDPLFDEAAVGRGEVGGQAHLLARIAQELAVGEPVGVVDGVVDVDALAVAGGDAVGQAFGGVGVVQRFAGQATHARQRHRGEGTVGFVAGAHRVG